MGGGKSRIAGKIHLFSRFRIFFCLITNKKIQTRVKTGIPAVVCAEIRPELPTDLHFRQSSTNQDGGLHWIENPSQVASLFASGVLSVVITRQKDAEQWLGKA